MEWRLNGQELTGPNTRPPYDWRWHSKLAYDGPALVQAVVLDQAGQPLAESSPVRFQVSNQGHNLRLIEPTYQQLLAQPIRGVVKFTLEADRRMTSEEQNRQKEKTGLRQTN